MNKALKNSKDRAATRQMQVFRKFCQDKHIKNKYEIQEIRKILQGTVLCFEEVADVFNEYHLKLTGHKQFFGPTMYSDIVRAQPNFQSEIQYLLYCAGFRRGIEWMLTKLEGTEREGKTNV